MAAEFDQQMQHSSSGAHNATGDDRELDGVTQQPIQDGIMSRRNEKTTAQLPSQPEQRDSGAYNAPKDYSNLEETSPHPQLEELSPRPMQDQSRRQSNVVRPETHIEESEPEPKEKSTSKLLTALYTHSYLIFFAILGTLARVGLTALTHYSGTPVIFNTIWANFSGSLVMGFLAEDRKLFLNEWGTATYDRAIKRAEQKHEDEENGSGLNQGGVDLAAAKKAHLATKKTIPLYIGLATGFCGSFTTFSSFIKDVFLALSNELKTPGWSESPTSRNGGYSFMAMLAVIITTLSLSLSGLFVGGHLAIGLEHVTPSIPFSLSRRVLDPLSVLLGFGCWLGAVILAIFPPHDAWRGQTLFALVFAPLGCLLRFYLSLHLNGKRTSFPIGTFFANVLGTVVLGVSWDLAHVPLGGVVGCQVLQGIEDGFCGCLTTISTFVFELSSLRRRSSWIYGSASVLTSLVLMIAVMGGLRWSEGYSKLVCTV
ncbi:related to chromosome condensation protein (CrcB) [Fusarium torulosum]|uniref:Related to chromosome condensation protein (CrcB) n=1 Tax=Fusarium torulosum TaxID=33205 RepID=A0AAE8MEI9_9HYPO|nr:related to chromosome condensation protein (CrcB) [Fusarium torulosum]